MPHPLITNDHLVGWFQSRVWDSGRPIISWITLESGATRRDSCCVGVCCIALKVGIVDGRGCAVGVVTALPVMS